MSRTVLNRMLIVAIAIVASLAWFLRRDVTQPNYVFTPEMVFSIPYDSFSSNPIFADGKTLQLPVAGTVAQGSTIFEFESGESEAIRAGTELTNPWNAPDVVEEELLVAKSRGRKIFSTFCLPCHGAVGNGDGPVTKNGFPPPPSLSLEHSLNMSDGQMFHVLTFGQKNMPGYAAQISADDRWNAILQVRSLQAPAIEKAKSDRLIAASIESGRLTFERLNCNKCHTVEPGQKPVGPFLGVIAATYTREQLHEAILLPSKTIAAGYLTQVFLMMDGTTHSGFVTSETDDVVTIRNSDGNEVILPVDDIDDSRTMKKSPMPEDLLKDLPADDVESLLDYLKSLAVEIAPDETTKVDPSVESEATNPANETAKQKFP